MLKRKKLYLGALLLIITIISFMTWLYPYSHLSIDKNYTYKPNHVLFNGKSYNEMISDFKVRYQEDFDADLNNTIPNLTINRTQYILPIFEQDWLISNEGVSIDASQLDTMLSEVKQVREVMLSLIAQADYTTEQKDYLVNIIRNVLFLEKSIRELTTDNYVSRSELKLLLNNLANDFASNFKLFASFYDISQIK